MTEKSKDSLGDRMKLLEQREAGRAAYQQLPLMARLDGRAFHSFCKGLEKPFDHRLSQLMIDTTKKLVEETQASVAFVQSDEISLCWVLDSPNQNYLFDGKFQKLTSVLASIATAFFNKRLQEDIPEKSNILATFDCRVWNVPSLSEAYETFLWRQQDATKNAVSMAAHTYFSHNSLQGLHSAEMQDRLFQEKQINFNNYPSFFKRGVFVKRQKVLKELSAEEMQKIPEKHRPTGPVERAVIKSFDCWLSKTPSASKILFGNNIIPNKHVTLLD